jgi:DNA-binding MarR family transcriptional regulator
MHHRATQTRSRRPRFPNSVTLVARAPPEEKHPKENPPGNKQRQEKPCATAQHRKTGLTRTAVIKKASMVEGSSMPERPAVTPARIWFRFLRLHQRGHAAMSQRLRLLGLSIAQFDLLSTLTEAEGITQRDLAERLYVTKGNVSGLVDRLVEAGLVDRRAIPGDRRSYALHLTDEGRKAAQAGMQVQQVFVNETVGRLKDVDLEYLDQVIGRWRDTFRALELGESGASLAEAGPAQGERKARRTA